jgi:hypothetical protein
MPARPPAAQQHQQNRLRTAVTQGHQGVLLLLLLLLLLLYGAC